MTENVLEVLLIEDTAGDARLIKEMLHGEEELLARVNTGSEDLQEVAIHHERRLSAGVAYLDDHHPDAILLDLGLPDSTGLDTLSAVLDETAFTPIVVLTGLDDATVGIEAIRNGAQDYLVKDETNSQLLVRSLSHAIERNAQELERAERREQLESLNRLNRIGQDITHAVIRTASREELERSVCEQLVASRSYSFAWIGEPHSGTFHLSPRVSAGDDAGFLEEMSHLEDEAVQDGPALRTVETQEVQVVQNLETDPAVEPWREIALERSFRAVATVPIAYQGVLYGVLTIYSPSSRGFSPAEVEILSRLGDVVGHAITALERKDALMSDTVVELEFRGGDIAGDFIQIASETGQSIELETFVTVEEKVITYGQSEGIPPEELRQAGDRSPDVEDVRILGETNEHIEFELVTESIMPLAEAVATHGGTISWARCESEEVRFVIEFPPGRDTRQLVELVQDQCPDAVHHAQRTVERTGAESSGPRTLIEEELTAKRRRALETAHAAGFFEWPRASTGEEIAERLGISPATFSQHLRAAERELFDDLLANDSEE